MKNAFFCMILANLGPIKNFEIQLLLHFYLNEAQYISNNILMKNIMQFV
jgi:hypothetical protein